MLTRYCDKFVGINLNKDEYIIFLVLIQNFYLFYLAVLGVLHHACSSTHSVFSSINELVEKLARSRQSKLNWLEKLSSVEYGRKKRRKGGRNKRRGHMAKTFPAKLVVQFTDCKNSILLHALLSVDLSSTADDLSLPT